MAISVHWPTGVITIQKTDTSLLTDLGSDLYRLDTEALYFALKDVEDDIEGMAWPRIVLHATEVTISGVTYVRFVTIINGYSLQFLPDTNWSVLADGGTNNNFFDIQAGVLVANTVQAIPQNSAGNTVTETGVSGLTANESTDLATAAAAGPILEDVHDHVHNKQVTDPTTGIMTLYEDDGVTPLEEWDIWEDKDESVRYRGRGVEVRDPRP